ncbi:NUDIX domain-containing protein [Patescibacteria group bacterium]
MELQVGVKAFLKNKEDKYLLLKRSTEKYPEIKEDLWDIVGGRIDAGVPLIEALKREIKEETGLELNSSPDLIAAQDILHVPGRHVVRLTFTGVIDGEPILSDEHSEYGWFTIDEIKQKEGMDKFFKEIISKEIKIF